MTEIETRADFADVRYGQCWEDADILLEGLAIRPGDTCVGVASAGDNCLAMLTRDPARVIAVDMNPSQLACLELRVAAYRNLSHEGLLQLIGSRPCADRRALYERCRPELTEDARRFWDARPAAIAAGIGSAGKFEQYFTLFRRWVLPLIHDADTVGQLLRGGPPVPCRWFYENRWNNRRWRLLFGVFFSRFVMGRLGRHPAFFRYVKGPVSRRILGRVRHGLTEVDPGNNPYLHWILRGVHGASLPLALRPESFELIRGRLDRLTWRRDTLETVLETLPEGSVHRFNLSDIFEYMSPEAHRALLERLARVARPGGRMLHWNMLAPRHVPADMGGRITELPQIGEDLLRRDKAFFYSELVVGEFR